MTSLTPQTTPLELSALLGRKNPPTAEQVKIIQAPLSPAVVVAGAGSGKTETMANRVVWLVATGQVKASEVLGMTFTRKAAGELSERIRTQLADLVDKKLVTEDNSIFDQATVTTYNSFANRIYSQYAVLIGRDPDATVLGEASAWQMARDIAKQATHDELADLDTKLDTLTSAILDMARALSDNIVDPDEVISYAQGMTQSLKGMDITDGTTSHKVNQKRWLDACSYASTLPTVVNLAVRYAQAKRDKGVIEFSDQVALALEICQRFPGVVDDLRSQFQVILLDEYQDTSVVQAQLLSLIFGGMGVMAVGDPHQSIYGWRGASADNLGEFRKSFVRGGQSVAEFSLSTSWRNPTSVLAAANAIAEPLARTTSVSVTTLNPREAAPVGAITSSYSETILEEASKVAAWFTEHLTPTTDAALLFRSLNTLEPYKVALTAAKVPFHVVGLGGLLDEPVVVDIVCTLRVLHDATADSELVRLLTGARWMIGARDVLELKHLAEWISARDYRYQKLADGVKDALKHSVIDEDGASLVDALDFLSVAKEDHGMLTNFSEAGLARMRELGAQLSRLRRRAGHDLRELITIVAQELLLDIEAVANESVVSAVASLDAFMVPVSTYVDTTERTTLGGFLSWLKEAERRERLSAQSAKAEKGVVQIMTIHASKGLEWDFVAVPRMVTDEFPGSASRVDTWLQFGQLPAPFRGDSHLIPQWNWKGDETQVQLGHSYDAFKAEVVIHSENESRRLAYVAMTRAKEKLLLAGSFWSVQANPRKPNVYLAELAERGIISPMPLGPESEKENPLDSFDSPVQWPMKPLNNREEAVATAALIVEQANPATPTIWDKEIELLLAERDRRAAGSEKLELPTRIPASKFKDFIDDPHAVAQALRRPLPEKPYRATNLGTLFHSWVEHRSVLSGNLELVDSTLFERDDELVELDSGHDDAALAALKATFERSRWANLKPVAVELEVNLPLGNTTVVCKIDAIYEVVGSNGQRVEIVDWKTGKAPKNAADLELKQFQLALYRAAYANWAGIAPENIDAVFYFVADDAIVTPERLYSEAELLERWSSVTGVNPR